MSNWGGVRPGSGRPKKPDEDRLVVLSTRIHPSAKSILSQYADNNHCSLGDTIEKMIVYICNERGV